jgi:hypothetical protein
MPERYIPKVREAAIPEDGTWAELAQKNMLILSIPEWGELVELSVEHFQYVWMYDRLEDAYLLCIKLNDKIEKAIAFAKEHAGLLLAKEQADKPFPILIVTESLEQFADKTPYLYLPQIELKRHPKAGW